jgi:hypothetical protein
VTLHDALKEQLGATLSFQTDDGKYCLALAECTAHEHPPDHNDLSRVELTLRFTGLKLHCKKPIQATEVRLEIAED